MDVGTPDAQNHSVRLDAPLRTAVIETVANRLVAEATRLLAYWTPMGTASLIKPNCATPQPPSVRLTGTKTANSQATRFAAPVAEAVDLAEMVPVVKPVVRADLSRAMDRVNRGF